MTAGSGSLIAQAYVKIRADTAALRSDLGQINSLFRTAVSHMAGVAGGILAAAGIRSFMEELKGVVGQFISVNNMFEQYQVSLGQLFKSDSLARQMILDIQEMARKTPFRMDTLTQSIVQLKIFGFENEKLIPTMRAIGDAAAASPRGMLDGVQRISYAIGEMRSHGRIMAAEMRQLASAGVPAWDLLAKATGKSTGQMRDLMRKGQVDAKTYLPMLIEGMANRFSGMMEKQSKTWGGLYSTFQDNMMLLFKDVGRPFFDLAKLRLQGLVGFMDSPRYQSFLPRMTEAVRTLSQFADRNISQAMNWLTGDSAYRFALKMRDAATEVFRISRVGNAKLMEFLGSDNVQAAVGWLGDATVWLTKMAGIGFDNVMDFLRGDTWAGVVRGATEYARQLYGIARMGFERSKEFFQSKNFENLTGQVRQLFGWLMDVRKVVVDFAGEKMNAGLAWLKGDTAAAFGSQIKTIGLEVRRIASISASNFWTFFTSDNLRLIALDLKDAAFHVAKIASVKLVAFSQWLNSSEATAIAAGVRDITKNLVYLIDNYGGLMMGVGIMVQFRGAITAAAGAVVGLTNAFTAGGLIGMLSPQGVLIAGAGLLAAAFIGARLEGEKFGDYMSMMLGRMVADADKATDAVSRLRRAERGEQEYSGAVGAAEEALAGDDTDANLAKAKAERAKIAAQEKVAAEELARRKAELADMEERNRDANNGMNQRGSTESMFFLGPLGFFMDAGAGLEAAQGAIFGETDMEAKKQEIKTAELAAKAAREQGKVLDERIKEKEQAVKNRKAQDARDREVERTASRSTLAFRAFNSGASVPWNGIASEMVPSEATKARMQAERDMMFQIVATATLDRRVGYRPQFAARGGDGAEAMPNAKRAAWLAEKERRQLEFLESRSNLSRDDKAKLERLRGKAGAAADDLAPGGSSKLGSAKESDFKLSGVVEFAKDLLATVNKTATDDAIDETARNTNKMASALENIQKSGVKIQNPPVARAT
jgi:tape measure domain-containing protein